MRGWPK